MLPLELQSSQHAEWDEVWNHLVGHSVCLSALKGEHSMTTEVKKTKFPF